MEMEDVREEEEVPQDEQMEEADYDENLKTAFQKKL